MRITDINLLDLISQGESETLEFKEKLPPENAISAIITAFANSKGGTLIIGVGDKGEIIGLTDDEAKGLYRKLINVARSLLSEPFTSGTTKVKGKWIIYIHVPEVPKYLYPVTTSTGAYYVRRGVQNVKVNALITNRDASDYTLRSSDDGVLIKQAPSDGLNVGTIDDKQTPSDDARVGTKVDIRGSGGDTQTKGLATKTYITFVAMSFRQEEEPALVDYYRAMERATEKTKLPVKLTRIDLVEGDYEISQKLMDDIDQADIVIADFTLRPSNVYFELGYARGRRKRIIQTARKDTALEFDIRNWRTIFYRNATELEEKLVQALDIACAELASADR